MSKENEIKGELEPTVCFNKILDFVKSIDSMAIPDVAEDHVSEPNINEAVAYLVGAVTTTSEVADGCVNKINLEELEQEEFLKLDTLEIATYVYDRTDEEPFALTLYNVDLSHYAVEFFHGEKYHTYIEIKLT